MRWFMAAVVVALVVGCGPSFQEADAIYKDEVAKLEAIQAEYKEQSGIVYALLRNEATLRDLDGGDGRIDKEKLATEQKKVDGIYKPMIEAQQQKVDDAFKKKEAAK